jgi:hypothetical protein
MKHHGAEIRRLSLTLHVEWVLGVFREAMAPYCVTTFYDDGTPLGAAQSDECRIDCRDPGDLGLHAARRWGLGGRAAQSDQPHS